MRRSSIAVVVTALSAACAAPQDGAFEWTPEALLEEPVVAHIDVGGVT